MITVGCYDVSLRRARDAMEKEGTNDDGDDDDEYGGSTEDETDDENGKKSFDL